MGFLFPSKFSKCLNILWALVMIILATIAYINLVRTPNHIPDLLSNWQQMPIYALKSIPNTESCPFGAETVSRVGYWPGTQAGCYCSSSGLLRAGPCASSDLNGGCQQAFYMPSWRGRILCLWRGGTAQYYVPALDSTGQCHMETDKYGDTVSFKICGTGSGAHCVESGVSCPITRMVLQGPGEPTPTGYSFAEYFGDDMVLHYDNSDASTDLPIIDITITSGPVCYEDPGDEHFYGNYEYPLSLGSVTLCNYNDSRYEIVDQLSEPDFLKDNDIEGITQLPELNMNSNNQWVFSIRRSIEWSSTCAIGPVSIGDVNDHRAPIENITRVQIALLVAVCVICFYLILDPVLNCIFYAKNEEDITEFDRPLSRLAVLEKFLKLLLLPFTIAAVWIVTYHHNWFVSVTARCCSDPLTNATFNFVYFSAHSTFLMDWAMFSLNVFILLADAILGVMVFIWRTKENF